MIDMPGGAAEVDVYFRYCDGLGGEGKNQRLNLPCFALIKVMHCTG